MTALSPRKTPLKVATRNAESTMPGTPTRPVEVVVAHPTSDGAGIPHPTSLLRLLTCGSVDDGKSTLIGRLLYDCRAVLADQLAAVESASKKRGWGGGDCIDLSLLTDGLRWEREQGITIDVAYRYFTSATRRYILIDSPGHVQYTRNMVTGASHADLAVLLVDARHGVQEQTHRHAYLAALLGIRTLIVAVNKMDLVGWKQAAFESVRTGFERLRPELESVAGVAGHGLNISYVPVSALHGDNIVHRSDHAPWHTGAPLLDLLEHAPTHDAAESEHAPARFPVQYVIRPRDKSSDPTVHDFRGYAGSVAAGTFRVGDKVVALSSGRTSTIASIHIGDDTLDACRPPQSVAITLTDDIDIGRGEMLAKAGGAPDELPTVARDLTATLIWMSPAPLAPNRRYLLRHTTHFVPAMITSIESKLDVHTLRHVHTPGMSEALRANPVDSSSQRTSLAPNDIATITLRTAAPIFADPYGACRATGSFVLIDETTGDTAAAGLIRAAHPE